MTEARPPLAGLRVIDVGTRISAPFCAGLLGEMGAEVIKVEDPRGGDFMRTIGPFVPRGEGEPRASGEPGGTRCGGQSRAGGGGASPSTSARPRGQELFRAWRSTPTSSVRTSGPARWRHGASAPSECDPRLVWARISVFGQDGPNARRPGLDRMGIAYGGLLRLTGYPDRPPVRTGCHDVGLPDRGVRRRGGHRRPLPTRSCRRRYRSRRGGGRPAVRIRPAHPRMDHRRRRTGSV